MNKSFECLSVAEKPFEHLKFLPKWADKIQ